MLLIASTSMALGFTAGFRYSLEMSESAERIHVDELFDTQSRARRELISAIGLDVTKMPKHVQAAVEALAGEVLNLREDRERLQAELEKAVDLADRDALCPIFNRRAFERELSREIALAERYGHDLSLIFIDLDRFGHATGDRVIQHVAKTLIENVRQSDIVGRLGGDEFGIALTHADGAIGQSKASALEHIIGALTVRDAQDESLEPVQLGASCGVVSWQRGRDANNLIAEADETMFRRKNEKKRAR